MIELIKELQYLPSTAKEKVYEAVNKLMGMGVYILQPPAAVRVMEGEDAYDVEFYLSGYVVTVEVGKESTRVWIEYANKCECGECNCRCSEGYR